MVAYWSQIRNCNGSQSKITQIEFNKTKLYILLFEDASDPKKKRKKVESPWEARFWEARLWGVWWWTRWWVCSTCRTCWAVPVSPAADPGSSASSPRWTGIRTRSPGWWDTRTVSSPPTRSVRCSYWRRTRSTGWTWARCVRTWGCLCTPGTRRFWGASRWSWWRVPGARPWWWCSAGPRRTLPCVVQLIYIKQWRIQDVFLKQLR